MMTLAARRDLAEKILSRYFPNGTRPFPLLKDIIFALGDAELRGYDECLRIMDPSAKHPTNGNDN